MWAVMKVVIISVMIDMTGAAMEYEITYDVEGPIHAEVGTSVIINCSYVFADFVLEDISWAKCDTHLCSTSDIIFHSSNANTGQAEFKDRVTPLEPMITQQNASIVIRDLRVSDTGSYQLAVYARLPNGQLFRYRFTHKKTIKVTGLAQPKIGGKTTVEGQDTLHLTCDAPSSPPSTVTWTKAGSDNQLATGTQRADLLIRLATGDDSGRYVCTAHSVTKTLSTFADVYVIEKRPIPETSFSIPAVITSTTIVSAFIVVLALIWACIYCLAKTCRRCPENTCTNQPMAMTMEMMRTTVVERVTQQTGGAPEDTQPKALVGVGETSREVPVPATTPV